MKQGTIFIAKGRLRRQGTSFCICSECGQESWTEFNETLRIDQRVIAAHAEEAKYLVETQYDVDVQSGVDRWLEPLTIEPLPTDQVLRELGAPELIPSRCVAPGFGAMHL